VVVKEGRESIVAPGAGLWITVTRGDFDEKEKEGSPLGKKGSEIQNTMWVKKIGRTGTRSTSTSNFSERRGKRVAFSYRGRRGVWLKLGRENRNYFQDLKMGFP